MLLLQLVLMIYFDGALACCNVTLVVVVVVRGGACAAVTVSRRNIHCMFLHYLRHRCICIFYCIETSSKWSVQLSTLKHLHIIISMDENLIAYSALQRNYTTIQLPNRYHFIRLSRCKPYRTSIKKLSGIRYNKEPRNISH